MYLHIAKLVHFLYPTIIASCISHSYTDIAGCFSHVEGGAHCFTACPRDQLGKEGLVARLGLNVHITLPVHSGVAQVLEGRTS